MPEGDHRESVLRRIENLNPDKTPEKGSCSLASRPKIRLEKTAYWKSLATQIKSLACSGGEDAVHIVRGLIPNGRISAAGTQTPDLVNAILGKDCPVSASLTEVDKAALNRIPKEEASERAGFEAYQKKRR